MSIIEALEIAEDYETVMFEVFAKRYGVRLAKEAKEKYDEAILTLKRYGIM